MVLNSSPYWSFGIKILFFCTEMLLFFNLKFIFFIGYKWQTVQNVRLLINYPNYYWMITPKCSCCDLCLLIWFVFVSFFVSILSLSWYLRVNNYSLLCNLFVFLYFSKLMQFLSWKSGICFMYIGIIKTENFKKCKTAKNWQKNIQAIGWAYKWYFFEILSLKVI